MARRFGYEWLLRCLILFTIFGGFIQALEFKTQPRNTTISDGSTSVVLDCSVNDGSDVTWYKDDAAIAEDFDKYTFITTGLRIKRVAKSDAGKYFCKAADGKKSKVASLSVEYICKNNFQIKAPNDVFRGDDITLTCNCPSVPTPAYTWKKDGNILAAAGKNLVITNAQKSKDDGRYVCIVSSGGRNATSLPHNLIITNCSPSKITGAFDKKTPFVDNKPLTIRCDTTGDPKPAITWYNEANEMLKNTSRIQILPGGALYFTRMRSRDRGEYRCIASNGCSSPARAKTRLVSAKIGKFAPMEDVLTRVGATVRIPCDPPSDSLPSVMNITWLLGDGNPLPTTDSRFKVVGYTLQIEKAQRVDSGKYKCVAENIAGRKEVDVNVIVAIYPQVTKNPVNKTVNEGESVKMQCGFSGIPRPLVTWEKDAKSVSNDANTIITSSGNISLLTIRDAVGDNSGKYRCVAKLKHVTERTKEATLLVKEKIVLAKIGAGKFDVGTDAKLKCMIESGTGPFNYRWTRNGKNSNKYPGIKVDKSILVINDVQMDDTANYTCYISNSFSSASGTFNVHIYDYAKIVLRPRDIKVMENGTALFDCKASGDPKPEIAWYYSKEKHNIFEPVPANDTRIKQLSNNSLLLTDVQEKDRAYYRCLAGNSGSLVQATAYLKVGVENITTPVRTVLLLLTTTRPTGDKDEHDAGNMAKTVGIAVGCAGAYIILVVGLMIYCKGRRARQAKNKLIINGEDMPLKPEDNVDNVEVVKAPDASKAKKYPRENLETLRTLGSGTYGAVFLAKASKISEDEGSSIVVVQSLTSGDEAVKTDFMRRMEMLSLKHENIAKLLGVCDEEDPMYLISEYPEQGDLKTVMRDSSSPLNATQKLNICAAVASGMNYLTNHGHVHKDLAARNCLVNKAFDVKISFLSLNQGTYPKEYYNRNGELIPLRWMAPEALEGNYSDMSDVWAYGVFMWEVYSEGMMPYEERPDKEVLYSVADDLRLTKPEGCPGKIYKMMEKCWADDKEDRLTFGELCEDLSEMPRESDL